VTICADAEAGSSRKTRVGLPRFSGLISSHFPYPVFTKEFNSASAFSVLFLSGH
jgi:hypothetical protein